MIFFCLFQDHLLERSPVDSKHQHAAEQSHRFVLVNEPHILVATNNEDRRLHDTESPPTIRTLDENIIQRSAVDTDLYNLHDFTQPDSLTQKSEAISHNISVLMEENVVPSVVSKGHWETNSHHPLLRNNDGARYSSMQQRESLLSVPVSGTGNIVYGSDQRLYRIHKGSSGPTGPQGKRVRIFLG